MSINYNAIVGNKARVTLPSVEAWGTNNNILKDPPKSITTRRIDKVNQDGSINDLMYESGDRFSEALMVYARGSNPMVSVQYSNQNGAPVKQPYRIIKDGAFRPPILTQEQLLPLSRQPRNLTQVITNKEFVDYSKRVTCPAPDSDRYFKEQPIRGAVIPNKYVKIEVPTNEHFVVNYIDENPLIARASTNKSGKTNSQLDSDVTLQKEVQQYSTISNPRGNTVQNYIHDDITLQKEVQQYPTISNPRGNTVQNYIHDDITLQKEVQQYSTISNPRGNTTQNYIHDDIQLNRNIPMVSASAPKTSNIHTSRPADNEVQLQRNLPEYSMASSKSVPYSSRFSDKSNTEHNLSQKVLAKSVISSKTDRNFSYDQNRTVNLPQSLHQGEYGGSRIIPKTDRTMEYRTNYSTGKTQLAQRMKEQMVGM